MTQLFGIGGRLTSGKDTVADYLVEHHGWVKLNMSAPLNDALLAINPYIPVNMGYASGHWRYRDFHDRVGYTKAKENAEVRRLLQTLGTEVGRNMIGVNTWVDIASRHINDLRASGKNVAITGIRFPNEFSMIRDNIHNEIPGKLVWVDRPGLSFGGSHASESLSSDGFDVTIHNNGTLEDLFAKVDTELLGIK